MRQFCDKEFPVYLYAADGSYVLRTMGEVCFVSVSLDDGMDCADCADSCSLIHLVLRISRLGRRRRRRVGGSNL